MLVDMWIDMSEYDCEVWCVIIISLVNWFFSMVLCESPVSLLIVYDSCRNLTPWLTFFAFVCYDIYGLRFELVCEVFSNDGLTFCIAVVWG